MKDHFAPPPALTRRRPLRQARPPADPPAGARASLPFPHRRPTPAASPGMGELALAHRHLTPAAPLAGSGAIWGLGQKAISGTGEMDRTER